MKPGGFSSDRTAVLIMYMAGPNAEPLNDRSIYICLCRRVTFVYALSALGQLESNESCCGWSLE